MSGFLGLVETSGKRLEEPLLAHLTDCIAYRGPDGRGTWIDGPVGLGHTLLRCGDDIEPVQPLDLGRRLFISADARIDDQRNLLDQLASAGRDGLGGAADAELILHAFDVWGTACVEHLHGDFAFAIWDRREQMLFCARDRIGIKPFYYASWEGTLLVGNTMESLRAHPRADDDLDERAIADYLLFSFNRHAALTAFAGIRRLPPAHSLTWKLGSQEAPQIERYWTFDPPEMLRLRREEEYEERFDELLHQAVADRIRGRGIAVLMSGGLDSTSVAAMAKEVLAARHDAFDLRAFTYVYEHLIDDPEREYSAVAAGGLGIPIIQLPLDDDSVADFWETPQALIPEPVSFPITRRIAAIFRQEAGDIRVGLTGQGGDPALHLVPGDFSTHLKQGYVLCTAVEMWRYRRLHGRFPRVGVRTDIKRWFRHGQRSHEPVYPPWLNPDLEKRLNLDDRFTVKLGAPTRPDALRPLAHGDLSSPDWAATLESYDPGFTKFAAEMRHPYFDLRLLEFLLALPPIPWCVEKEITRRVMRGRLPDSVVERRKAPLARFPIHETLVRGSAQILHIATATPLLAQFVDVDRFAKMARRPERLRPAEYDLITRPLGLALWLRQMESAGTEQVTGELR